MKRKPNHHLFTAPGTIPADPGNITSEIEVMAYGGDQLIEQLSSSLTWVEQHRQQHPVTWINVEGLDDTSLLTELGRIFQLHSLALEDVVQGNHRAKVDSYDGFTFLTLRMISAGKEGLETEQLSLFLGADFVITFQEGAPGDCLEPVRERLRRPSSRLRSAGADFLAYSLLDAVVDAYFPYLETMGDSLEELEDEVLSQPSPSCIAKIHRIRRDLLTLRRSVWPLREMVSGLMRGPHESASSRDVSLSRDTQVFLRDCYDHVVQIVDLVETYRELSASLTEIYLSSLSNKMNQVMKVLTVITTIFVPLTFVAGVYGMNFNPEKSPWNMPELNAYWGYPGCICLMFLIASVELIYFARKGWIFPRE